MPCAQRTVNPKYSPPKIALLDFLYSEWGDGSSALNRGEVPL
jgi:hypothetical protein